MAEAADNLPEYLKDYRKPDQSLHKTLFLHIAGYYLIEFSGELREKLRANGSIKNELNLTYSVITDRATRDQADGNNVDNDTQMAELANTQIQYDALINSMNGNFTRMRSALVTK